MKKIILFVITILAFSWSFSFAENSVIELSSAEDLQLLAEHPDGDFVLTDDVYFEPDTEWVPPVFRGHLNGNGYTIYNVHNTGLCPETRTVYDGNYKEYDGAFAGLFGILDGAVVEGTKNFTLHYNFPGFATGEAKAQRSTSRREIGHGNLAERALKTMVPHDETMPYTIRIVSDILESNGSSSMASVCGGCLALMDAGVPMRKPVAGVAMGMISDSETGKYAILTDILGDEDHLGDMDFKVTGTRDGITACQMDIKVDGLSYEVLTEALEQARQGRLHILDEMAKTITEPRADYKEFVPRIETMYIPKDMIGAVIGPGGKIIQEMQKETNTVIVITEDDQKGIVEIASQNKEDIEACKAKIRAIVQVPEVGEVYHGKIVSIMAFGAFVEIIPNKDGLLHISEIDWKRYETMEETGLKEGDEIDVKLVEIDQKTGKLRLSHRALLPKPEGFEEKKGGNGGGGRGNGGNRGGHGGGNRNGGGHGNGGGRKR